MNWLWNFQVDWNALTLYCSRPLRFFSNNCKAWAWLETGMENDSHNGAVIFEDVIMEKEFALTIVILWIPWEPVEPATCMEGFIAEAGTPPPDSLWGSSLMGLKEYWGSLCESMIYLDRITVLTITELY